MIDLAHTIDTINIGVNCLRIDSIAFLIISITFIVISIFGFYISL